MSDAPTIWQHAWKILGSFNANYYGPVVSGVWLTPKMTSHNSSENVNFQPLTIHCAQISSHTPMKSG